MASKKYIYGIGRRKSSTARARLFASGKGNISINNLPATEYLDGSVFLMHRLQLPLALLEKDNDFDITLVVRGGGVNGQVDACKLAISNALATLDEANRGSLKKAGYLKRDPREKERKKYGLKSARKKEQFSKR